jgi:hypothetical protein
MNVLTQLFTGKDGITHDLGRWGAAASFLTGLGLQIYAVMKGAAFDMQNFGLGIGALSAGVGAMLKLKETTEP